MRTSAAVIDCLGNSGICFGDHGGRSAGCALHGDRQYAANRKPSARKLEDERIKVAIKAAHERGRGTYGPDKIRDELAEVEQMDVGINRIKRLRRQMKIRCKL